MNYLNKISYIDHKIRYDKEHSAFNICIIGNVNTGRSTILNTIFGENFIQYNTKLTNVIPIILQKTNSDSFDSVENINKKISEVNKEIISYIGHIEQGNSLFLEDYGKELKFNVRQLDIDIGIPNDIDICIWEIPGLNDFRTKETYYKYLKDNFQEFNIILFVVDINSGMNTNDEIDIVNFLTENILKHKNEYNKNIKVLTIVNKTDDMKMSSEINNKLEIVGEEHIEMYDQVVRKVNEIFENKGIQNNLISCIPICGRNAHLYGMIKKYKNAYKLLPEEIQYIGLNEHGSRFRSFTSDYQAFKVYEIIQNEDFINRMIKLSGFSEIVKYLYENNKIENDNIACLSCEFYENNLEYIKKVKIEYSKPDVNIHKLFYINIIDEMGPMWLNFHMEEILKILITPIPKIFCTILFNCLIFLFNYKTIK